MEIEDRKHAGQDAGDLDDEDGERLLWCLCVRGVSSVTQMALISVLKCLIWLSVCELVRRVALTQRRFITVFNE